jgi:hypothetical protein
MDGLLDLVDDQAELFGISGDLDKIKSSAKLHQQKLDEKHRLNHIKLQRESEEKEMEEYIENEFKLDKEINNSFDPHENPSALSCNSPDSSWNKAIQQQFAQLISNQRINNSERNKGNQRSGFSGEINYNQLALIAKKINRPIKLIMEKYLKSSFQLSTNSSEQATKKQKTGENKVIQLHPEVIAESWKNYVTSTEWNNAEITKLMQFVQKYKQANENTIKQSKGGKSNSSMQPPLEYNYTEELDDLSWRSIHQEFPNKPFKSLLIQYQTILKQGYYIVETEESIPATECEHSNGHSNNRYDSTSESENSSVAELNPMQVVRKLAAKYRFR